MQIVTNMERIRAITGGMLRPGGFRITDRGLGFCNLQGEARILDAGCGTGSTTTYLANRYRSGVYGVDLSGQLLKEARTQSKGLSFVQARLESLPFGSSTFDAIICECVLCHTSMMPTLEEFYRLIKDEGFLILSDLYWKIPRMTASEDYADVGLMAKDQIMALLEDLHFRILNWEDRTRDLKNLAVHLVMDCDLDRHELFQCGATCIKPDLDTLLSIGYYLLVAKKMEKRTENER